MSDCWTMVYLLAEVHGRTTADVCVCVCVLFTASTAVDHLRFISPPHDMKQIQGQAEAETVAEDPYLNFRGNRLALRIACNVHPTSGEQPQPWCLFYTNVLKFVDKIRVSSYSRQLDSHGLVMNSSYDTISFYWLVASS